MALPLLVALSAAAGAPFAAGLSAPALPGAAGAGALLQTWDHALEGSDAHATPVARVVGLLKEMTKTLQKDMDQDEALYKELSCWCNNGNYEKTEAIKASEAKIDELGSNIESLTAKSSELSTNIKELEAEVASDKQALAEAIALREKQLAEFHGMEKDSIQAVENLKAAIGVLDKHHGADAAPDSTVAGGAVFKSERDSWASFVQGSARGIFWSDEHEGRNSRSLDSFMRQNGFDGDASSSSSSGSPSVERPVAPHKFLQQQAAAIAASSASAPGREREGGPSAEEDAVVKRAMRTAAAFMQAHHSSSYFPAYNSQSGEIFGVLKQLKEQMEGELSDAQQQEQARAAAFAELRAAKESELANGEKMAETKEDQLADTNNNLAEAKEDLQAEENVLGEDQLFLKNLKDTCADAGKNFEERKNARMEEMKAVSETISILQADESRDAMSGTYSSFVQVAARRHSNARAQAADRLRKEARRSHNPELSILATSVELDSFTRVKKAIDDMISMLKAQQEDEVKKTDWCKDELHDNELTTAKREDKRADLESHIGDLASTIKAHEDSVANAKSQVAQLQLDLQRATEDRQKENLEFQKTVADQTMTVAVLKKALDRLATYYDFLQQKQRGQQRKAAQTPPVAQMEYAPSKGSTGVMEMIEKLVHEAEGLRSESRKSEGEAQAAYEQNIADTNASVEASQKAIVTHSKAKAQAHKDKLTAESDHADTLKELDGLSKYNGDLHADCDYVLQNFDVRQSARSQEIQALQQAKQILSGASLS